MEETFRPRKPEKDNIDYEAMGLIDPYKSMLEKKKLEENPPELTSSHPIIAKALFKNKEKKEIQEELPTGPRLAFTGNDKLDTLLAGIKEKVYQYEEVLLPSLGKFYTSGEAPSNGILHVRPMTGVEDEILGTHRYMKKGQTINMIFRNCVQESIKPELLLAPDRNMLLIYIRGISQGSDYEVEVRCPNCAVKSPHVIDLDKEVTACPEQLDADSLMEILPVSGYRFTYRFANGKDDNLINDYRERRAKRGESSDDTFAFRASLLINSIEDPASGVRIDDQPSIKALVSRLPVADLAVIRGVINDPPFGLDTKCPLECPNCSENFEIELPMEASFFYPKKKSLKHTHA